MADKFSMPKSQTIAGKRKAGFPVAAREEN
jgi:hypothetical protein